MIPSLPIVVPVFNEPEWIGRAIADVIVAQQRSPFREAELIVVDDGSDAPTRAALAALDVPIPLRVIRQENAGRFAARRVGLEAASGRLALLVDSRVSIGPDALRFVAERLPEDGALPIWNAHVDIELRGNPFARFWNVLTEVAFADYFADPRTTSFGRADFDRFPKGTTCFLAPRRELLSAIEGFSTYYADTRDANDDTTLIRALAERARINISPGFSCRYRSRRGLRRFLRHAHHRGVVLVDGHLRRRSRFLPLILAFFPGSLLAIALAVRHPGAALATAFAGPGAVGLVLRRPPADVLVLAALGAPWLAAYGAGVWRGAALALVASRRRG
jgi:hypothetical protein